MNLEEEVKALQQEVKRLTALMSRPRAIYLGDHEALTEIHNGCRVYVDTRDVGICSHLMWGGRWETWIEQALMPCVRPGMQVCDIGANFGYYTLLMASTVGASGKVYSFEANPEIFRLLEKSVSVNGFRSRVDLHNVALAHAPGVMDFAFEPAYSGGGSVVGAQPGPGRTIIQVRAERLDDLVPPDASVQVMKIDVEGAEAMVLAGGRRLMSSADLKTVVMEFYAPAIAAYRDPLEFLQELASYGFNLSVIEHSGSVPEAPDSIVSKYGKKMVYLLLSRTGA